jgi:hypothetical protein
MPTITVHRTCLHCATETTITVSSRRWHAWTTERVPAARALAGLDTDDRRWLTQMTCPACYRCILTNAPANYYWEGRCAGCGRWETFAVPITALHAFNAGELTTDLAFPHLTADQRCLLEMYCHIDCYDVTVYGPPPGEPRPFAHLTP